MSNPHITFDPSAIIQSRRFGCQTVSGLTAQELLRSNVFIYQPKSSFKISPYDIENNSFAPLKTLSDTDEFFRGTNNSSDSIISVDNYDPRTPTNFTDNLTLLAIKNLGIQQSDLFFPTNTILDKINGDKRYFETLLVERALKYRDEVRKERQKIIETTSNEYINNNNNIINSNILNYDRKGQIQRPSTGLRLLRPTDALEKAKIITEQQNEEKKKHERILQNFHYDRNIETQTQIDILDDKKKRTSLYNLQIREDTKKIDERENDRRKKESLMYISRPSSRKKVIRSSLSQNISRRNADLSPSEQKNVTFLD